LEQEQYDSTVLQKEQPMNEIITTQLEKMKIKYNALTEIRTKDGISVFRVASDGQSYVLKFFANKSDRREIDNYRILNGLDVPTLRMIASTDCALLMEDIEQSEKYRLGTADDLSDAAVSLQIAKWYKLLHSKGYAFVETYDNELYDESDVMTKETIHFIKKKTQTQDYHVWGVLLDHFEELKKRIAKVPRTLLYNNFYYTNLIVAMDKSEVFMFDYNLLGQGYAYSDIRNICSSLSDQAKAAFLTDYGECDESELVIDDVVSPLTTLYFACKREIFPKWAEDCVTQVKNGNLLNAVIRLLG
jgi:hypothetical protein